MRHIETNVRLLKLSKVKLLHVLIFLGKPKKTVFFLYPPPPLSGRPTKKTPLFFLRLPYSTISWVVGGAVGAATPPVTPPPPPPEYAPGSRSLFITSIHVTTPRKVCHRNRVEGSRVPLFIAVDRGGGRGSCKIRIRRQENTDLTLKK